MKSEENRIKYSTLKEYFEGKASEEETASIHEWMGSEEGNFQREKSLHLLWNEIDTESGEIKTDLEALLDKIHHSIHLSSARKPKSGILSIAPGAEKSFSLIFKSLTRIAAIFLIGFMTYIGWQIYSQNTWMKNQAEVVYTEIKCPLGAMSHFELPDGTTGNLNNGSRLRYPSKFTGDTREIELYGEAFFDVKHNKQKPFIINTVGLDVKVLGTRLNVYSYPDEDYQEITLESGSVELVERSEDQEVTISRMKPGQHVVYKFGDEKVKDQAKIRDIVIFDNKEQMDKFLPGMRPGQQAMLKSDNGELYMKYDETDKYTGWKAGKLILRNDPMPVLLKRMERWYNVHFIIKDAEINDFTYWATFEEENIDQVLRLLSLTGPVKFNKLPREKLADGTYKTQEIEVFSK